MRTSTPQLVLNQDVVFDTVVLNVGGGFDPAKGLFVAPVAGVYVFHLSVFSDQIIHCSIVVNGQQEANAFAQQHSQGATSLVIHLGQGDSVTVKSIVNANGVVYGDLFSSFSGFLQSQD